MNYCNCKYPDQHILVCIYENREFYENLCEFTEKEKLIKEFCERINHNYFRRLNKNKRKRNNRKLNDIVNILLDKYNIRIQDKRYEYFT